MDEIWVLWQLSLLCTHIAWVGSPYLALDTGVTIIYPLITFGFLLVASVTSQVFGDSWLLQIFWNIVRSPFHGPVAFKGMNIYV